MIKLIDIFLQWYDPSAALNASWTVITSSLSTSTSSSPPLKWYYLKFPLANFCLPLEMEKDYKSRSNDSSSLFYLPSYALYIGGMTKGVAWVNGRNIGRYWAFPSTTISMEYKTPFGHKSDRQSHADICPPANNPDCDYPGSYDEMSCRHGCGEVVQPFMHVPFDWVSRTVEDGIVSVVLFDEAGGANVSSVHFVRMAG